NLEDLKNETTAARQIGFTGKCAIHPKQVAIINEIFSPSDQEIKKAENLIKKYEEQDKAFVKIDGILMEKPVLQRLYRTLAIAKRIES
ncbi:MAG: HpcH/HpaI aldolase/citrate lyase family protein, partial [Pseudomonadota bacterium]|nr:HpcH/HpaI aldolase/citrate lyase family protein [Pseudomonadota bacterium]